VQFKELEQIIMDKKHGREIPKNYYTSILFYRSKANRVKKIRKQQQKNIYPWLLLAKR